MEGQKFQGRCEGVTMVKRYLFNILLWLDLGANTLLGGDPQETLSSRFAKAAEAGRTWAKLACRILGWIDKGHFRKALDPQEGDLAIWRWQ